jgi:hypothetical protein
MSDKGVSVVAGNLGGVGGVSAEIQQYGPFEPFEPSSLLTGGTERYIVD